MLAARFFRYICRSLADSCFIPGLRMQLYRISGIGIGKDTFVNMKVMFVDNYRGGVITLGDRVAIAPGAVFIADSDPNHSKLKNIPQYVVRGTIEIGDDSWIGSGAIILPNVRIGKMSIVGAGAIVTKNVEDYAIYVGNPARKIGVTNGE